MFILLIFISVSMCLSNPRLKCICLLNLSRSKHYSTSLSTESVKDLDTSTIKKIQLSDLVRDKYSFFELCFFNDVSWE